MKESKRGIVLFAGTTEGRLLAACLQESGWPSVVCVATEYGKDVLDGALKEGSEGDLKILRGRLMESDMEKMLDGLQPGLVIDATHPYAVEVTENIRRACAGRENLVLLRCLREDSRPAGQRAGKAGIIHVPDVNAAAAWLDSTEGSILVTTGSKELAAYSGIRDYRNRVYARVLPSVEAVALCGRLGYGGRHIIAMQGPFSEEMNRIQLKEYGCSYLVTKDGGKAGGFEEKMRAAEAAGVTLVVIDRPGCGEGASFETIKQQLKEWMDHEEGRTIYG